MDVADKSQPSDEVHPRPFPSAVSVDFWEGCRSSRLLFQRCEECGLAVFPPEPLCAACLSNTLHWEESAGIGTVYTFTITRSAPSPGFPVPTAVAIVELDEGYSMFTNIVGCAPEEVQIGQRVTVQFAPLDDVIVLPMFRLLHQPHEEESNGS